MPIFPLHTPLSGAGAATYVDPTDPPTSGMVAWYRAQDGITLTDGGITQWNDISGNGYHLIQDNISALRRPTIATAFLNGLDVAAFNGSTQFVYRTLTPAVSIPFTIMTLFRNEYTYPTFYGATGRSVCDSNTVNSAIIHATRPGSGSVFTRAWSGTHQDIYTNAANPENLWSIVEVLFNNASSSAWHSGLQTLTGVNLGTNGGLTGFRIGVNGGGTAGQSWQGKVAEVMIWNRALTAEERTKKVAYLVHRYNPGTYPAPTSPGGGAPATCPGASMLIRDKVYGAYCWSGFGS